MKSQAAKRRLRRCTHDCAYLLSVVIDPYMYVLVDDERANGNANEASGAMVSLWMRACVKGGSPIPTPQACPKRRRSSPRHCGSSSPSPSRLIAGDLCRDVLVVKVFLEVCSRSRSSNRLFIEFEWVLLDTESTI